jgi:hypothetical protein
MRQLVADEGFCFPADMASSPVRLQEGTPTHAARHGKAAASNKSSLQTNRHCSLLLRGSRRRRRRRRRWRPTRDNALGRTLRVPPSAALPWASSGMGSPRNATSTSSADTRPERPVAPETLRRKSGRPRRRESPLLRASERASTATRDASSPAAGSVETSEDRYARARNQHGVKSVLELMAVGGREGEDVSPFVYSRSICMF